MKVSLQMTLDGMLRALKTKRRSVVDRVETKRVGAAGKRPKTGKERRHERGRA